MEQFDSTQLVTKLNRDLIKAMASVGREEARFLVASYYLLQDQRERCDQQLGALEKEAAKEGRSSGRADVLHWLGDQYRTMEGQVRRALLSFASGHVVGQWSMSLVGIGPVISAGLLAHIDIKQAPTVGHIWRFAGLDPSSVWRKGEKRPWNPDLKVLCWHIGQCLMRTHNHEASFYGSLYRRRKAYEVERNLKAGDIFRQNPDPEYWLSGGQWRSLYAGEDPMKREARPEAIIETAFRTLRDKKIQEKETRSWYERGMLPPGRIEQRAERWTTKLFLSHWHAVAWETETGEKPVKPYILTKDMHQEEVRTPNWPMA